MSEDIPDRHADASRGCGSAPARRRVSTALELLEGIPVADYDALPASQRAQIQEALEHLRRVEDGLRDGIRRE